MLSKIIRFCNCFPVTIEGLTAYTADRFKRNSNTTAVVVITKDADSPTVAEADYFTQHSLKVEVTTADASVAAGDYEVIATFVEGYNFAPIAQQVMTLSFWVKSSKTGIYCVALQSSISDRSFVSEYTINSANTWENKTITIDASPSAGTWNYTNGIGLAVQFTLMAGATYQGTADAWQSANIFATSNQVNFDDTIGNTFQIALVQLEKGSSSSGFERRSIQSELELCQRYFNKSYAQGTNPGTLTAVGAISYRCQNAGVVDAGVAVDFPVTMRATPTITTYSTVTASAATWYDLSGGGFDSGASFIYNAGQRGAFIGNLQVAGDVVGYALEIQYTAEAEL